MNLRRRWVLLTIVIALPLALGPGCKELDDAMSGDPEKTGLPSLKPKPPRPVDPPAFAPTRAPDEAQKRKADYEIHPPNSVPGRMLALLKVRLACTASQCRSENLARIREARDHVLPGLPSLLARQPPDVTMEAVRVAGLLKYRAAIPGIGRLALEGETEEVRIEALWALGAIADVASLEYFERMLMVGYKKRMAKEACRALGNIGTSRAIGPISEFIAKGDIKTRQECARALGRIGAKDGVKPLVTLAEDGVAGVERAALLALVSMKIPEAETAAKKLHAQYRKHGLDGPGASHKRKK